MMTNELILGQLVALALGALFFIAEFVRLKRFGLAALEGFRFWALISAAELTVWLAVASDDSFVRVCIAALGTILAALVVNNAYAFAHRALQDGQ